MQRRKSITISIFSVLVAACLALGLFFITPKNAEAMADSDTVKVGINGELTELSTNVGEINVDVLNDLYEKLAGSGATLSNVKSLAATPANTSGTPKRWYAGYDAEQLRSQNSNKDIVVKFGGLEWTVVYLSNDRNNEPVVTLWLTNSALNTNIMNTTSKFSEYLGAIHSNNVPYPANRYSTSTLRSALNLGTVIGNNNTSTQSTQSASSPLAPFTMTEDELVSEGKHSLMKYIDMPYLVYYQEKEAWLQQAPSNATLNIPNAAYGIPAATVENHSYITNSHGYAIQAGNDKFNLDYNSYDLYNYMYHPSQPETNTSNNNNVINNMDLSKIFSGKLYDDTQQEGQKWKKTSEWTKDDLSEMRTWTAGESWAFDTLWVASYEEAVGADSNTSNTIWKASASQRAYLNSQSNMYVWLRSGVSSATSWAYLMNAAGNLTISPNSILEVTNGTNHYIRPALHLNLAQAEANAVKILKTPQNITLDYDGKVQNVDHAASATAAAWYDNMSYSTGVEITYSPDIENSNSKLATNVGEYETTLKLDKTKAWENATSPSDKERKITIKVNPAKITVDFTQGSSFDFAQTNDYLYRSDGGKHALKFPADVETWDNVIQLANKTADDAVEIKYCTDEHDETTITDHAAYEQKIKDELLPNVKAQSEDDWLSYSADNDKLNVNKPGGYCVFYRIKSANYVTEYGYFSVHIATEELTVHVNSYELHAPYIYGAADIPDELKELKKLAEAVITEARDNGDGDGEDRLPTLNKDKFNFYLIDQSGKTHYMSDDPEYKSESRLDVGEYSLGVRYVDGDNSSFIKCKWENDRAPKLTINPKFVNLDWAGNAKWSDDQSKVSKDAQGNILQNDFNWVYDGSEHAPTASFSDLDGKKINVRVTGGQTNANTADYTATAELYDLDGESEIKNYTFDPDGSEGGQTKNDTQTFRIHKSINWWDQRYEASSQSLNQPLKVDKMPKPHYGDSNTVKIQYYKYNGDTKTPDLSQEIDQANVTKEGGLYYVKVTFDGTGEKNFDGLNSEDDTDFADNYIIKVSECAHNDCTPWTVYESDNSKHTRTCNVCGEVFIEDHSAKKKAGGTDIDYKSDGTNHWAECESCGTELDKTAHGSETVNGEEATCEHSGWTNGRKCPVCGRMLEERQVIEQLPHNFGTPQVTREPTCLVEGQQRKTCSDCNTTVTEAIEKKPHDMEYHAATAATETENGNSQYWQCTSCHKYFNDSTGTEETTLAATIIPALGMDPPAGGDTGSGSGSGSGSGDGGSGSGSGSGSTGGDEGSVNPPLGGDTGLNGNGADNEIGEFFKENWWWMLIILAVLVLLIILLAVISAIKSKRRERLALERDRERDRQLDTLIKMQMMHSYGGFNMAAPPADGETPALDGQSQPAQLPFNQDMFNAAISAAVSSAMAATMQAMKNGEFPMGQSDSTPENPDVDGFYDSVDDPDDPTGSGQ